MVEGGCPAEAHHAGKTTPTQKEAAKNVDAMTLATISLSRMQRIVAMVLDSRAS